MRSSLLVLVVMALAGAPAPTLAVAPFFTQSSDCATASSSDVADVDGNGLADLIGGTGAGLEVRLAAPERRYGVVQGASFLAPIDRRCLGDFDGDGDPDAAGVRLDAVELLFNAGAGAFGAPTTLPIPVGYDARNLAAGDLDGDDRDDIVVAANVSGSSAAVLIVYLATPGGFAPPFSRPTGPLFDGFRHDLVVADVDGDPWPDVVLGGGSDGIAVHRNAGDGSLLDASTIPNATFVNDLEVADVDGDGAADIAVGFDAGTETLRLYPGNGDGTFGSSQVLWTGPQVHAVGIGDVDGGGAADVVFAAGAWSGGVLMLRGEDALDPGELRTLVAAGPSRPLRVGDLDADGMTDVFVGGPHGIYWGDDDGTPGEWAASSDVGGILGEIALADVSGDGTPDLVTSTTTASLIVERARGNGTFDPPVLIDSPNSTKADFGDVDGDGDLDAVLLTGTAAFAFHVALGTGDNAFFSGSQDTPIDGVGGSFASVAGVAVGDVDLDGRADVVVSGNHGGLTGPGPPFLRCYRGLPDGTLALAFDTGVALGTIALGDADGNGVRDLFGVGSAGLEVRLGSGTGTFGAPSTVPHPVTSPIFSFTLGAVDAGTTVDVVAASYDGTVSLARGNDDGTLQPFATVPGLVLTGPWDVTLADVDDDGDVDAAAAEPTAGDPGCVQVALGDGSGAFPESFLLSTGSVGQAPVRIADLNGDARPDLVCMGYSRWGRSTIHLNTRHDPTAVTSPFVPADAGIALSAASPQRGAHGVSVRFTLSDGAPAVLELLDLGGRCLERLDAGRLGRGVHTVTLGSAQATAPGVYVVRLSRGGQQVTQRIATLR